MLADGTALLTLAKRRRRLDDSIVKRTSNYGCCAAAILIRRTDGSAGQPERVRGRIGVRERCCISRGAAAVSDRPRCDVATHMGAAGLSIGIGDSGVGIVDG